MEVIILVIHVFLAASLIGVVLLQPPESSSLGGLGASNPMSGGAGRGQGNLLTRMTAILAAGFIVTSLVLAFMASHKPHNTSILDEADTTAKTEAPAAAETPAEEPKAPSVPVAQ